MFKKHSKFQNFDEIFYSGMTRLRNTNLDVFIQFQYTISISRKKNMRQSMLKKHSNFLIFHKVFIPNVVQIIGYFQKIYVHKNYCKKENYETRYFKKMFLVSPFQLNISIRHKQTDEQKLSQFSFKAILSNILRKKNIGKIYQKHKIREIIDMTNCDMTKALEHNFYEKTSKSLKE